MPKFVTTKRIELGGGDVVGLSKEQAGLRKGNLDPVGNGKYKVTGKIVLKAGEAIEFDSPPKRLALSLRDPDEPDGHIVELEDTGDLKAALKAAEMENEELLEDLQKVDTDLSVSESQNDALKAENEELKAEVEKLKAELEEARKPKRQTKK